LICQHAGAAPGAPLKFSLPGFRKTCRVLEVDSASLVGKPYVFDWNQAKPVCCHVWQWPGAVILAVTSFQKKTASSTK
jgi:hypothetical protein